MSVPQLSLGQAPDPTCTRAADGTATIDWHTEGNVILEGHWVKCSAELLAEWIAVMNENVALKRTLSDLLGEDHATQNGYRIALRPDHKGHLDDVVVSGVKCFRMEDMGSSWWIACYLAGSDDEIVFDIAHRGGRAVVVDKPEGYVYEPGSM